MKPKTIYSLILWMFFSTSVQSEIIPPEKGFPSPDRTKLFKISDVNGDPHFLITNTKTSKTIVLDSKFSPIFAVVWSSDSKSIYVLAHVSKGVLVQILNLSNNEWLQYTIDVPEKKNHESEIVNWIIKPNIITLIAKVSLQKENGASFAYYLETFDVDPTTGKSSNLHKKSLNRDAFNKVDNIIAPEH